MNDIPSGAERLNHGCFCITLDRGTLAAALDLEVGEQGFAGRLSLSHPTLFSNVPVFVPSTIVAEMAEVVAAVEAATLLPQYRVAALSYAPKIANHDFGPVGVLMGYDFHVTPQGPKLIEVNTNAGGAFLNAFLARAQHTCCATAPLAFEASSIAAGGAKLANMFIADWQLQRTTGKPTLIAIVDDEPEQQYLYPELRLAEALLKENDMEGVIADAGDLHFDGRALTFRGRVIDVVYNRLVDFALDEPRHAVLRAAYVAGAVVLTPNPHVHALFADKRNLTILSDFDRLKHWELAPGHVATLERSMLKTVVVSGDTAEELWRDRRHFFFKPSRGYGSKAAYRGDKITRRVWGEIINRDYVAQSFAPPGVRGIAHDGIHSELKVDIRLYTYAGRPLLAAARLYRGQTTNMRTPGGGFAPVFGVRGNARGCGDSLAPLVPRP
jgi:hypothetical protein